MRNRRLLARVLLALFLMSFGIAPATAIDPYTAASIGSALLPRNSYSHSAVVTTSSPKWFYEGELIAYGRESAGLGIFFPDFGEGEIPIYFGASGGKGTRRGFVSLSARADLRQDKEGDKRPRKREEKGEDDVPLFYELDYEGELHFLTLDLEELEVGPHTFRRAADIEGGKESTYRWIMGKTGRYKAKLAEVAPLEVNLLKFTDSTGRPKREYWDAQRNRPNFAAIVAKCPGLVLAEPDSPVPQVPIVQMIGGAPLQLNGGLPATGGLPERQRTVKEVGETASDRKVQDSDVPNGMPTEDPVPKVHTASTGAPVTTSVNKPEPTGTNRWLTIVNALGCEIEFSCQRVNGKVSKPLPVAPGAQCEIEIPEGSSELFRVFVRRLPGGKFEALPNSQDSVAGQPPMYDFPLPAIKSGRRIRVKP